LKGRPINEPTYEELQREELTYEQVQRVKYELWSTTVDARFEDASTQLRIVAEGDSWFDYPVGLDILDHLKRDYRYEIFKVAEAGDTLENMVYGTEIGSNFFRRMPPIEMTLSAIERYQPKVFLFSGGGNDIAGSELASYLNHKSSTLPVLREDYLRYVFSTVAKRAYKDLIKFVTEANSDIHIISHGYGYATPDGRSVRIVGIRFAGPWLRPILVRKNIIEAEEGRHLMRSLIDRFNEMLQELENEHDNFHYIDLRPHISDGDWTNELHLYNQSYRRVAERFHRKIQQFVGG
jgi:hypothetical protein